MKRSGSPFLLTMLVFGFAFLYVPILSLIVYSFNSSRLATVWGGFSTKWYGRLFENEQILDAALLSFRIAAISATLAVILGVEAMCAGQGIEARRPLATSPRLAAVLACLRAEVAPLAEDRYLAPDIAKAAELVREGRLLERSA